LRICSAISRGAAKDSFAATAAQGLQIGRHHGLQPWLHSVAATRLGYQGRSPCLVMSADSYFGSVPFPSRTKVNSFGGTVGPAGALPGTAPGAGGGALASGGSTIPWPPRKATYCFPSSK